ncbi:hypothetical protein ASPZODRAFT_55640 [Penicilliopsis zonata CBS 506.65]|uniref:Laccase n=1 Tax=Penicilliopsis zonata CBS 506.65 TaxID=1073090 RepID=A0A1L9SX39_9EURO|nr:hypothetical protein ASPZODRAFT_55640 [Penicilliopsis zonata CBS 506.65]OJJ51726.1 hypothetical protein ASPZODRAFT_55640 [Penicilliopsis zonata CBS 506.65]
MAWSHAFSLAGSLLILSTALLIVQTFWTGPGVPTLVAEHAVSAAERRIEILLHPQDHVLRPADSLRHVWNITSGRKVPDGVAKDVFLINGQFPGPTIEARSGDVLEVEVWNSLADEEVSIHWHGLLMRGANHMDGATGITQCAIPPGASYTYRFRIEQEGTFWYEYHAHSDVQRSDGLYGGLVVHPPGAIQQDEEILLLAGDWYHRPAGEVLDAFMDAKSDGSEPCPDSLLINGLGHFDCSRALPAFPVDCSPSDMPWIQMDTRKTYRVRVANVGALTGISITIPNAQIQVTHFDGQRITASPPVNSVGVLYPGERVDFILSWNRPEETSQLIIDLDKENFQTPNLALSPTQSFAISDPKGQFSSSNQTEITSFNLQTAQGLLLPHPLPEPKSFVVLYSAIQILVHEHNIPMGFINRTHWKKQPQPLLSLGREDWNSYQLVPWTGPEPAWIDIVINNMDVTGHPFHLHGTTFYVLSSYRGKSGWDYFNPFDTSKPPKGGAYNVINPLEKDTVYVPPLGYVVLRFRADNEGIWMLHCHVLWHQASGMSMAVQVLGDEHAGFRDHRMGEVTREYCSGTYSPSHLREVDKKLAI